MVVVFLNCFLRSPGWIFHDKQSKRIPLIPQYTIQDNDTLIGLCEVFGDRYCKKLAAEYKKYNYSFTNACDTSSGLAFAYPKNYKLISNTFKAYEDSKLPDSLVNKGFMHCVVKCKDCGKYENILITHLQCTYIENSPRPQKLKRFQEIQKNQLFQLNSYIVKNNINDYILMGDFNIHKDRRDPLFMLFINLFDYQDKYHLLSASPTFPKTRTIIDYILVKNQTTVNKTKTLSQRRYKKIIDKQGIDSISDHTAIVLF